MMDKEIGGYFGLECSRSDFLHKDAIALNSGRNCLKYLIEARRIKRIWVPDFICDAVELALAECVVDVLVYPIGKKFLPCFSEIHMKENDFLYLVDYYGQLSEDEINKCFFFSGGCLILDAAHNYFSFYRPDIDVIYTCRKFFGVPDGGFLYLGSNVEIKDDFELDRSFKRMGHILGRVEADASSFYLEYQKNEQTFFSLPIRKMSLLTRTLLASIDYDDVRHLRKRNFLHLHEKLAHINQLSPICSVAPYMYPLMLDCDIAQSVRTFLVENKVYVPLLWPNVIADSSYDSFAYKYACSIVPLPIDQRYSVEDMDRVASLVEIALNCRKG